MRKMPETASLVLSSEVFLAEYSMGEGAETKLNVSRW